MRDLTEGRIAPNLISFTIPMLAGSALQTGLNIVDTFFVGRLGADAVAAVSLSFTVIFVLVSAAMGLTVGTTTLVAQYIGAKQYDNASKVILNSVSFAIILAVIVGGTGIALSKPLLRLMDTPAHLVDPAAAYMNIIMGGMIFLFLYFLISAILRGAGDSTTPLKFMAVGTVLNVVLDPVLILGAGPIPGLGVSGAALATVIAQGVAAIMSLRFMQRQEGFLRIRIWDLGIEREVIRQIIRLGLPGGVGQTTVALANTVVISTVAAFGAGALAAFGIGARLDSLMFLLAMSLQTAVSAMVGQSLGAGLRARVYKTSYTAVLLISVPLLILTVIYQIWAEPVIAAFVSDPEVIGLGAGYIRIVSLSYVPFGILMVLAGVFRGTGDMVASMILTAVTLWGFRVPLAILLSKTLGYGVSGVWWGITLSVIVGAILSGLYFIRGKWIEKSVVKSSPLPGGEHSRTGDELTNETG